MSSLQTNRPGRWRLIHVFFSFACLAAGCMFVYKLFAFLTTIKRDELAGFAFDPIVTSSGLLSAAYLVDDVERVTRAVTLEGQPATLVNIPQRGQTDLRLLTGYAPTADLVVTSEDAAGNSASVRAARSIRCTPRSAKRWRPRSRTVNGMMRSGSSRPSMRICLDTNFPGTPMTG